MKIALLLFLILNFHFVNADIVYIDANDTNEEINLFKEYAKCKGEKLIVLPRDEKRTKLQIPKSLANKNPAEISDRDVYKARGRVIESRKKVKVELETELKKNCGCGFYDNKWNDLRCPTDYINQVNSSSNNFKYGVANPVTEFKKNDFNFLKSKEQSCVKAILQWNDVLDQLTSSRLPSRYHADDLRNDLLKVFKDNKISSVVLSGHHYVGGGINEDMNERLGGFQGLTAWIDENELSKAFENIPNLNQVESVFLLSCKPLLLENAQNMWLSVFPQVTYVGGYQAKGYLSKDPNGTTFLREMLSRHDDSIDNLKTANSIDAAATAIREVTSGMVLNNNYAWKTCIRKDGGSRVIDINRTSSRTAVKASANVNIPLCKHPREASASSGSAPLSERDPRSAESP